ncbi:hypothetical protein V6N13_004589 [Hibiscus sabdariffa]
MQAIHRWDSLFGAPFAGDRHCLVDDLRRREWITTTGHRESWPMAEQWPVTTTAEWLTAVKAAAVKWAGGS